MRIVIDMQGAQTTGSRNRGIGRYTLSLSKAIARNQGEHEIVLVLNGLFHETVEPILASFEGLLPQENIRVWYSPDSVNSLETDNHWRRKSAELVREAFIASLKPDVVLVSSLFEGLDDDAVTSIGLLGRNTPTATILYDLIPLINYEPYLENPLVEVWYQNKLDHLRRSERILAISESSRQESIHYLGFQEETTVNISTAADHRFQPQFISHQKKAEICERYKLHRPYIMYTGGIDYRKNIDALVRAYAGLPKILRTHHQLVIVCAMQPHDKVHFKELAKKWRLEKDDLVLPGFIPDDDLLTLYRLCKVLVFPSLHEGFGLPALEAMSCGRAVIGSNTSSVPEVIGREDALFDPKNDAEITDKIKQVLNDDAFRIELERHGIEQAKKFSWDKSATKAMAAIEQLHRKHQKQVAIVPMPSRRPRMAYLSPMPPERSGISDYSAELLPELSRHYDIDVIVTQGSVTDPWVKANCKIRDAEWFRLNADRYERVLYHFGNSEFHKHMFSLLEEIPGIVVLHDFFLSGIVAYMEAHGFSPNAFTTALYNGHGYAAVYEHFYTDDISNVIYRYPCNLSVLRSARNIIVHSEYSRALAKQWYTEYESDCWTVIPLLRVPAININRSKARDALSLGSNNFVICSFGSLSSTKLNHRLLKAWLSSRLANDDKCILVFVGENEAGKYGQDMLTSIRRSGLSERIRITGWTATATYRHYLAAADIAVQLRTKSRGETSSAVLDCMNYGLPTIVNANGSLAELADKAVCKLPDKFSNEELIKALEGLWTDKSRRAQLGKVAQKVILDRHAPRVCADQYFTAIERSYRHATTDIHSLTDAISKLETAPTSPDAVIALSKAITKSISPRFNVRQLLIDITGTVLGHTQDKSQLNFPEVLHELLSKTLDGFRVEPVYATADRGYIYARSFAAEFLGCPPGVLNDEPIEYYSGDFFLGLETQSHAVVKQQAFYEQLRCHGVSVNFVISEPIPQDTVPEYKSWLEVLAESDGVFCINRHVSEELKNRINKYVSDRLTSLNFSLINSKKTAKKNKVYSLVILLEKLFHTVFINM